jgi:DNA processing protein
MAELEHRTPLDPSYPARLRVIDKPPASVTLSGGPLDAAHTVAIVGTREPTEEAITFTRQLAGKVVRAGAVVVSGGALGVDSAAHEAALEAGGRTWVVAATGHERCFPPDNAALFERVAQGPGTMLWPFAPKHSSRNSFLVRNRFLVALSDAVVVTQAGFPSGALNAASWAQRLRKPLWVVPAPPWMANFEGSRELLDRGAPPLTSAEALLRALGLAPAVEPAAVEPGQFDVDLECTFSPNEFSVFQSISNVPLHTDAIASRAGQSCQATTAALLTLALEDVVVEGPPGFFRRRKSSNP